MADLFLRLKLRVEVMIMKCKLVYTRLQARNQDTRRGEEFSERSPKFLNYVQ